MMAAPTPATAFVLASTAMAPPLKEDAIGATGVEEYGVEVVVDQDEVGKALGIVQDVVVDAGDVGMLVVLLSVEVIQLTHASELAVVVLIVTGESDVTELVKLVQ